MIHLDTSFLIQAFVPGTSSAVRMESWLAKNEEIGISSIAWSEFLCGPLTPQDLLLSKNLFTSIEPFLDSDAEESAELFNLTGRRSRSLADCQIAAVALRCDAQIATANTKDFLVFQAHGLMMVT
jgi:predicted nucleic acid-binding protein